MKNPAQYLYLIPLFISMIASMRTFKKNWAGPYRAFSMFLCVTFLVEIFAIAWKLFLHQTFYWDLPKSNTWLYNLFIIPIYFFYLSFFGTVLENIKLKRSWKWIASIYCIFGLLNLSVFQTISQLNTFSVIIGSAIVIICSSLYFLQELNRKIPVKVTSTPLFWIALGALIFHSVSLPYFIFINYLSRTNLGLAMALFNIHLVLNILMYSFYLIAFLCKNPAQQKSS